MRKGLGEINTASRPSIIEGGTFMKTSCFNQDFMENNSHFKKSRFVELAKTLAGNNKDYKFVPSRGFWGEPRLIRPCENWSLSIETQVDHLRSEPIGNQFGTGLINSLYTCGKAAFIANRLIDLQILRKGKIKTFWNHLVRKHEFSSGIDSFDDDFQVTTDLDQSSIDQIGGNSIDIKTLLEYSVSNNQQLYNLIQLENPISIEIKEKTSMFRQPWPPLTHEIIITFSGVETAEHKILNVFLILEIILKGLLAQGIAKPDPVILFS